MEAELLPSRTISADTELREQISRSPVRAIRRPQDKQKTPAASRSGLTPLVEINDWRLLRRASQIFPERLGIPGRTRRGRHARQNGEGNQSGHDRLHE
jgi:hypothetical protein